MKIALENATLVLQNQKLEKQFVLVENKKISKISSDRIEAETKIDLNGNFLLAGFIDIHNHGAIGIDVNQADTQGLYEISKFLISKGVTAWLPTLVPDEDEVYHRLVQAIDELTEFEPKEPIAKVLGIHYEGIFANRQMCGALRPEFFKTFTGKELESLPTPRKGAKMMTMAPEIEGGLELIEKLKQSGWIVSIGHTKANKETLDEALKRGAKHLTHFFNAMSGIHHREIGVAGWGLISPTITFDIIADKIHVHPEILKLACEIKTPDKVLLISDSIAPTGLGDGIFELWGEKIQVLKGKTKNARGNIAGSVITLIDAFKNMVSLGFSIEEVAKMASTNAAKLLNLQNQMGSIEIGKTANLVAIDENLKLTFAIVGDKFCFFR
ncbi:MAG: N-acetylglucosamine-6-phosphate deacetylase [Pyrinomonadaceae bacterium]|nr:N-acetylglucosamine-6-phosphate deacetylase [Pyrinomonadaceae bacterium]MCX7640703.1 N-acetylglucosamine-6-phosphate deacetylase [Pyrinomonadaceae bacterium]MDW8305407.1 N-acetylglucosamine-6-phosphate deacetylase [Acidobacteriota bacterium]